MRQDSLSSMIWDFHVQAAKSQMESLRARERSEFYSVTKKAIFGNWSS